MKPALTLISRTCVCFLFLSSACAQTLTPEQKQTVANLKEDLRRIQQEITDATQEDAKYSGGVIKVLVDVRLQILKTNAALVEQRIQALESGARQDVVVNVTKADPAKADELVKEIAAQEQKVAEARREADRYSGGLIQAISESTVATNKQTLAMLEQQYFIAKYGMALLPPTDLEQSGTSNTVTAAAPVSTRTAAVRPPSKADQCLKIDSSYDSSVLSSNTVYTELAWKADIVNACAEAFSVRVTFRIYDKDEFELDSNSENMVIPASGVGKARGKLLVSPPDKARRMAKQGINLSLQ